MVRVAAESTNYLTDELKKHLLDLNKVLNGQKTEKPRWKKCTGIVMPNFMVAFSALYVRNHFDPKSKKVALEMVNAIREEFEEILEKVSWMDETTRAAALSKVKKIKVHIGYPDELIDDQNLIKYYEKVEINELKFLESALNLKIFTTNRAYNKFREIVR